MEEIEVKVIEVDDSVLNKLDSMGARRLLDADVIVVKYDFHDRALQSQGASLRLEKQGDESKISFNKIVEKGGKKILAEIETKLDDFDSMDGILRAIGMEKVQQYKKHRIAFEFGDFSIAYEKYEGIPALLEIKTSDIDKVYELVRKLGIDERKVKNWSTEELFDYYDITNLLQV
ncbi:hypothetical protein DRN74_02820 [Candidatus Micrarchaeota archaeon]|nr:MAG: hypothetical protein DRN74_02820 [Candidatus Micrarchaeota archaeon]